MVSVLLRLVTREGGEREDQVWQEGQMGGGGGRSPKRNGNKSLMFVL